MQVIHISQTEQHTGYELVNLLANRYSRKNGFLVIEKGGEIFMSGGFVIEDIPLNRKVLDSIPINEQWDFVKSFKVEPFEKLYYVEDDVQESTDATKCETYTTEKKHQLLKDVDFPSGFGFWKTLRVILWDFSPNKKKINAFYFGLDIGKHIYAAYKDALNA